MISNLMISLLERLGQNQDHLDLNSRIQEITP